MGNRLGVWLAVLGIAGLAAACGSESAPESGPTQTAVADGSTVAASSTVAVTDSDWTVTDMGTWSGDTGLAAVASEEAAVVISDTALGLLAWVDSGDGFVPSSIDSRPNNSYALTTVVAPASGGFLATTTGQRNRNVDVFFSSDGASWTPTEVTGLEAATDLFGSAATDDATFLMGGLRQAQDSIPVPLIPVIWRSEDLDTWTQAAIETRGLGSVRNIVDIGTALIAVGNDADGAQIWRSSDTGMTWSRSRTPEFTYGDDSWELSDITTMNGTTIAVGEIPTSAYDREVLILVSINDGESWARFGLDPQISAGLDRATGVSAADGAFWITSNRPFDEAERSAFCGELQDDCDTFDPAVLLRSENGRTWSEVDLSLLAPTEPFDFDDVIESGDGISLVVSGNALQVWTWPSQDAPPMRTEWPPTATVDSTMVSWDAQLELEVTYPYLFYVHCGMELLGGFNGTWWYLDGNSGPNAPDNPDWPIKYDELSGLITLVDADTIELSIPSGEVIGVYRASDAEPDGCS